MKNLEAATKIIRETLEERGCPIRLARTLSEDLSLRVPAAQFRADYGCQHCGGLGYWLSGKSVNNGDCDREHVELDNLYDESVVYADPDKCEWRCDDEQIFHRVPTCKPDDHWHARCRWVPKWEVTDE